MSTTEINNVYDKAFILNQTCKQALDTVTALASKILNCPISIISLSDKNVTWIASIFGASIHELNCSLDLHHAAMMHGDHYAISNAAMHPTLRHHSLVTSKFNLRFYASVPLITDNGDKLGLLSVIDLNPKEISEFDLEILKSLAKNVTAQLSMNLKLNQLQHEHADGEGQRYQLYLEGDNVGDWDWDIINNRANLSENWMQLLGYQANEVSAKAEGWLNRIHRDDRKKVSAKIKRYIQIGEGVFNSEHRMICKDGSVKWILTRCKLLSHTANGKPFKMIGTDFDITKRKLVEIALQESERKFRIIFERNPLGIAIIDSITGVFQQVNPRFSRIVGWSVGDILSMDWMQMTHPDDIKEQAENMELMLKKQTSFHMIKRYLKPDNEVVWVDVTIVPIGFKDASPIHICIIDDITEKRKSQEQLKLLETSISHLNDVVLITEAEPISPPGPRILFVNDAFERMTGFTRDEAIGNTPRILQGPNTQKAQLDQIKKALSSWKPIRVELINYKKDGSEFWMELDITPIADSTGWYTHWVAIERDITERKLAESKIEELAFYDSLTELPNRRLLIDRLKHQLVTVSRSRKHGALFFIDLDNFKSLNDSMGHDIGDLLLIQVAQRLSQSIRKGDTASRFGGDEFVLMLPNLSEIHQEAVKQANIIGKKIMAAFAEPFLLKGTDYLITPSIGIALFSREDADVEKILKKADLAMYQAKAVGKNTICFFSSLMQEIVTKRATLESELWLALDQEQFVLHYQPQISLKTPFGVEALVRWDHPQLGMISPADFIPVAEETSLIIPLGIWVLKCACHQLVIWSKTEGLSNMTIAVNVSVRQFSHISFIDDIKKVIKDTNVDPSKLKLELTESILVSNTEDAINKINILKAMGIGFVLDDFGIGYSSLSYLKQLPLDQIKIDQSFVRDILIDSDDATIVISIIRLAQSLNIDVIAEGVETQGQLDYLSAHGCEKYQGYLFSRPLPILECEKFLLEKTT